MTAFHSTHGHRTELSTVRRPPQHAHICSLISVSFDVSGPGKSKESERRLSMATFGRSPNDIQNCRWMSTYRTWLQCRDCGGLNGGNGRRLGGRKNRRLRRRHCRWLKGRHLQRIERERGRGYIRNRDVYQSEMDIVSIINTVFMIMCMIETVSISLS